MSFDDNVKHRLLGITVSARYDATATSSGAVPEITDVFYAVSYSGTGSQRLSAL